jgi:hypothetical protein
MVAAHTCTKNTTTHAAAAAAAAAACCQLPRQPLLVTTGLLMCAHLFQQPVCLPEALQQLFVCCHNQHLQQQQKQVQVIST